MVKNIDADIVGFSCYMWNFNKQMKLAKLLKEKNPNVLIVAGGPHIPNIPSDFFKQHPYVDIIVHNEGEITFAKILKEYTQKKDWSSICGITTPTHHSLHGEKYPKEIKVQSPYTAGYFDQIIDTMNDKGLEIWALWETNRGCPYQCSFCDWGSSLMNKVRKFSMPRLFSEIHYFASRKIENVYICDANFGMLPRDEDIADELAWTKQVYKYPSQIRGSFAKHSNNRVFNITKTLFDEKMIYGTTLSMQSMDMGVLAAIDRKNIGIKMYEDLQKRYNEEGLHTYSELILPLPKETYDSFLDGICSLLSAGNHEDIRVWELSLLPNAPMSQDTQRALYSFGTAHKRIHLELPKTPEDEIEHTEIVTSTNTMNLDEWVESYLFAIVVQALHCGYYTRYVSEFLVREGITTYRTFYEELINHFTKNSGDLSTMLGTIRNLLYDYANDKTHTLLQRAAGYGPERRNPSDWLWLTLNDREDFYAELYAHLTEEYAFNMDYDDIFEVISLNEKLMLKPDYDPSIGASCWSDGDWIEYFKGGKKPRPDKKLHHYKITTTRTGIDDKYELVMGDDRKFSNAAVGEGFLVSRYHHYAHPLEKIVPFVK
jgi:putative methyltransferase